jgi:hypothetical protein
MREQVGPPKSARHAVALHSNIQVAAGLPQGAHALVIALVCSLDSPRRASRGQLGYNSGLGSNLSSSSSSTRSSSHISRPVF